MAFVAGTIPKPSEYFPNLEVLTSGDSVTATGIFIPLSDLPGLTAAEADPDTGDGREVIHKLVNAAASKQLEADEADRPQYLSIQKTPLTETTIPGTSGIGYNFGFILDMDLTTAGVAPEPAAA